MTIHTKIFTAICGVLLSFSIHAQNPSLPASDPEDKWDLTLGVHVNFSQATGPALRYLKERTWNENQFSTNIISYHNRFKIGTGVDVGTRYQAFEKVFVGFGFGFSLMRMMPTSNTTIRIGTASGQSTEIDLTHQLVYLSPKIEAGKEWGKISLSGGLSANILATGTSFHKQTFDPSWDGLVSYRTGVPVNDARETIFLELSIPGSTNYTEVDDASNYGYLPITYSAFTDLRFTPSQKPGVPYFKIGYQFSLSKYKEVVSVYWDTFAVNEILSEEEYNLATRWHSFSLGMGWTIL